MTDTIDQRNVVEDLNSLDVAGAAEEGHVLYLKSPATGREILLSDGSKAYIKVRGMQSEKLQRFVQSRMDNDLQRAAKGKVETPSSDDLKKRQTDLLIEATMEWNLPLVDGKPLPFNANNARKLYDDLRFVWIRNQVDKIVGDEDPFLQNLKTYWKPSPDAPSS